MPRALDFAVANFAGRLRVPVLDFDTGTPAVAVPGLTFTAIPSGITEGGATQTLSFQLRTEPESSVTVTVMSGDTTALTVAPPSRLFTTANWDTEQSVTLTAPADSDAVGESVAVTLDVTSDDDDYSGLSVSVDITVTDAGSTLWLVGQGSDYLSTIQFNNQGATATRVGNSTNFGISENQPNGLAYHNGTLYMVGNAGDYLSTVDTETGAATRVGSATVFGIASGPSAPIGLTSHGGTLYMVSNAPAPMDRLFSLNTTTGVATIVGPDGFGGVENEPRCLVSDGTSMYISGRVNDQLYNVNPTTGIATAIGSPSPATHGGADALTFHEGALYLARANVDGNNWATARLMTVNVTTGVGTPVTTSSNLNIGESAPKGLASNQPLASGASGSYMGFVPSSLPSTVTEGGTATFNVKLNAAPTEGSTVTVAVTSNHPNAITVTGGASLTFDGDDWDTDQTVTLTATSGGGGLGAHILLTASGGGFDDNVMQFFPEVTPIDDSIIAAPDLWVREGRTKNVKVRLSSQPTSDVTLTTTSANSNKVYITAGGTHTFTTTNWNANHGIDIYAYADADSAHEHVDLTMVASGGGNSATAVRTIHIYDDD